MGSSDMLRVVLITRVFSLCLDVCRNWIAVFGSLVRLQVDIPDTAPDMGISLMHINIKLRRDSYAEYVPLSVRPPLKTNADVTGFWLVFGVRPKRLETLESPRL